MNLRKAFSLAVIAVMLVATAPVAVAQLSKGRAPRPSQIKGQVRMADGTRAPARLDIELEMMGAGAILHVRTDDLGKFEFTGLLPEVYYVRISHPDFYEIYERVDLTMTSTGYVHAMLKAVPRSGPPSVPPEGPNAVISASPIPDKARKAFEDGQKKLSTGQPGDAVGEFNKAVQVYPQYADAWFALGTANMDLQRFPEAEQALQKCVELVPQNAAALLALGVSNLMQKDFPAAEQALLKMLQVTPDAMEGHYELARTYWNMGGRDDDAERHARKAVSLKADYAPARVVLGNVFLRKKEYGGALLEFKEYLRLEPQGPMSAGVRDMVGKLEKQAGAVN